MIPYGAVKKKSGDISTRMNEPPRNKLAGNITLREI